MSEPIYCFSCADHETPATAIALAPHKDGGGKIAFAAPLCHTHAQVALVAGWYPQYPIDSADGQREWNERGFGNPHARSK